MRRRPIHTTSHQIVAFCVAGIVTVTGTVLVATVPPGTSPEVAEFRERLTTIHGKDGLPSALEFLRETLIGDQVNLEVCAEAIEKLRELAPQPGLEAEFFHLGNRMSRGRAQTEVYRAYWEVLMDKVQDPEGKIAVLLEVVKGSSARSKPYSVRRWAADELCDRGVGAAWPDIQRVYGKDLVKIQLCEEKIQLLAAACGDPVTAMAEALRGPDPFPHPGLHFWALQGLQEMQTDRGDAALLDYLLRLNRIDWYESRDVAALLKMNGWTDEDLLEKGWNSTPPCLRIPRECPPAIPDPKP